MREEGDQTETSQDCFGALSKTDKGQIMNWLIIIISFALAAPLYAAETKPKAETFLDPTKAGPDYADQGEYKNDWGAAQIIALGEGEFRMVTYRGGLPGDGWDKEYKTENPGKREGNKIVFTGE